MSQPFTRTQNNGKSIMGLCENTLEVSVCISAVGPGGKHEELFISSRMYWNFKITLNIYFHDGKIDTLGSVRQQTHSRMVTFLIA